MERQQNTKWHGVKLINFLENTNVDIFDKDVFKMDLPKNVSTILKTLKSNGYEAYVVGGCVRDAILGVRPSDYDITTSATPMEIKSLFKKTIDTGIKHGTVSVVFYEDNIPTVYEVTTFRIDGEYEDSRHPKEVTFTTSLIEDLSRRDFTINAFAYDETRGLIDEFMGISDLRKKIVRCIGNPVDRFTEDALRILRSVRFAAKLGFKIDQSTENAVKILAPTLANISKERVQVEITKTLLSKNPDYIEKVFELGLAPYITKDFERIIASDLFVTKNVNIAYASFLYNNEDIAKNVLKDLKLSNDVIKSVLTMLASKKYIDILNRSSDRIDINAKVIKVSKFQVAVKKLINEIGFDLAEEFLNLIINKNIDNYNFVYALELLHKYKEDNTPIFIKDLKINGKDLMDIGFKGEEVGASLNCLLNIIHERPELNENTILVNISKKVYKKVKKK